MSADTTGAPEAIELPAGGDAAFAVLMDTLVAVEDAEAAAPGGAPAPAAAPAAGQPAPAGQGAPAAGAPAAAPAGGDGGQPGVAPAGAAADAGAGAADAGPPAGTFDGLSIAPEWGKVSTALESKTATTAQEEALVAVRNDYEKYFEAIEQHPRLLIGKSVPKIGGAEGETETLRDSDDAKEWQEAVKGLLLNEVKDRAIVLAEAAAPAMQSIHQSIELFQNNVDLIPGASQFDKELADRLVALITPYEHRVDGKLHGYSIPVQPIINQLRTQLTAERAAGPATTAPAAAAPVAPAAAPPAPAPVEQPQAGIPSKAGGGGEAEDFSALFGTIGLPGLRI